MQITWKFSIKGKGWNIPLYFIKVKKQDITIFCSSPVTADGIFQTTRLGNKWNWWPQIGKKKIQNKVFLFLICLFVRLWPSDWATNWSGKSPGCWSTGAQTGPGGRSTSAPRISRWPRPAPLDVKLITSFVESYPDRFLGQSVSQSVNIFY